jgi:geranylgeranyl reductase family protein
MIRTVVCIIGAGPAGAMAALRLAKDNIPFVVLEKDTFPREKVCGDALSGKVPHIIRRLSPQLLQRFEEQCMPLHSHGIRFTAPGNRVFDVPFIEGYDPGRHHVPGYTVKRALFDTFLAEEVSKVAGDKLKFSETVRSVLIDGDGVLIRTNTMSIRSKLLIDAAGANATIDTYYERPVADDKRTALAVRTYYQGVTGLHRENFIELLFLDNILPGYFWIFPLPDGLVNVGIGIRKDVVHKKKIRLAAEMENIINTHPLVAPRFRSAEKLGKAEAQHLPLGNPASPIAGNRFMLAGDAAHLVDPLTGEGVGNALYSGYIAAEQAIDCLGKGRFDAGFMHAYDARIQRVLGKEMSISRNFQRMLRYRRLVRWIARRAEGNRHIPGLMSSMFTDLDHRRKLLNPFFLMRVLMNR